MARNFTFYIGALMMVSVGNAVKKSCNTNYQIGMREIKGHQVKIKSILKIKFEKEDFKGVDARYTDFSDSTFIDVDFTEANLKSSIFENVVFKNVKFTRAYLIRTKFINCKFDNVDFEESDLSEATLIDSLFSNVNFINANVENTLVYYPLDDLGKPLMERSLKLKGKLKPDNLMSNISLISEITESSNKRNMVFLNHLKEESCFRSSLPPIFDERETYLHTLRLCLIKNFTNAVINANMNRINVINANNLHQALNNLPQSINFTETSFQDVRFTYINLRNNH